MSNARDRAKRDREDVHSQCCKRPSSNSALLSSPLTSERAIHAAEACVTQTWCSPRTLQPQPSLPFAHRMVVAPLVGASDLAFRVLCHRHGADLCYSEMLHSDKFLDRKYRHKMLLRELIPIGLTPRQCSQQYRQKMPLVVQLCGTNPETVLAAAQLAVQEVPGCCCIDLNLGCPQLRALSGGYGAFTPHETALAVVAALARGNLGVPVSCKIRLVDGDIENTIQYAKQLQAAGCNLLAVHGRFAGAGTERRRRSGAADLHAIKCVKEAVSIPVLSNGNVKVYDDVLKHLKFTGADGVMVGEAVLGNPALFELCGATSRALGWKDSAQPPDLPGLSKRERHQLRQRWRLWLLAQEYLGLAKKYPAPEPMDYVRSHIRWMLGKRKAGSGSRSVYTHSGKFAQDQLRAALDSASDLESFVNIVDRTLGWNFQTAP